MERLTNSDKEIPTLVDNAEYWLKVYFKLKDYENLEEQGRLVKLPCKVGDTVYVVTPGCETVEECKVMTVNYSNTATSENVFYIEALPAAGSRVLIGFYSNKIGKTAFLTKSEAEARLKEPNYIEEVLNQCPSSDFKFVGGKCPKCGEYVTSSDDFKKCHYCGKLLKWKKWDGAFKLY